MTKQHHNFTAFSLFLMLILLMTGCQPVIGYQPTAVTETSTAQAVVSTATENMYPSTPEEVIRSFLIAYPLDQIYAVQFLSPSFVQLLDAESVSRLLPNSGEFTGFIIESGSTSAESEKSKILTNVAYDNTTMEILFTLEIVDGRWVIKSITQK